MRSVTNEGFAVGCHTKSPIVYYSCNYNSDNVNDSKNSLKQVKNTSDQLDVIIRVGP